MNRRNRIPTPVADMEAASALVVGALVTLSLLGVIAGLVFKLAGG